MVFFKRESIGRNDLNKKLDAECKVLVKLTKEVLTKPQIKYPGIGVEKEEGFDIGFRKFEEGEMVISVNPTSRQIGVYEKEFLTEADKLGFYFFQKGYVYSVVREFE